MKKISLLYFSLLLISFTEAQIKIKGSEQSKSIDVVVPSDSVKSTVGNGFKTSTNSSNKNFIDINLNAFRSGTTVTLSLLMLKGSVPSTIIIERKSSAPLSEYRTIKELSLEELQTLDNDKKLVFSDNFPESRQLDSYYRIRYEFSNGIVKVTPGILLLGENASNALVLQNQKIDTSIFISDNDKALLEEKKNDYGVKLTIVRNISANEIYIVGSDYLEKDQQIYLERQTSEYLSTFRKFKDLSPEEIATLLTKGELLIVDKYPPSSKLTCYYRLVVQHPNKDIKEFPAVELPALRAK